MAQFGGRDAKVIEQNRWVSLVGGEREMGEVRLSCRLAEELRVVKR